MTPFTEEYDYHKHQSVYISDYIKFADAKAGATLGVAGVFFAFFANELKGLWKKGFNESVYHHWPFYAYGISLVVLGIGILYLMSTIWPRYKIDKEYYHSWGGIAAFNLADDYKSALKRELMGEEEFLESLAAQNYTLATICKTKYRKLRWAYFFLGCGVIISGATWILVS